MSRGYIVDWPHIARVLFLAFCLIGGIVTFAVGVITLNGSVFWVGVGILVLGLYLLFGRTR